MDLSEFLLARFDDDEAVARSAEPGPWTADGGEVWAGHPSNGVVDYARGGTGTAEHIARWDPDRVHAECDAKRRLIEWVTFAEASVDWGADFVEPLRLLALPYADHPDYDEAWRPAD